MIASKKILIVSYVFPPYPGIGGRRWVKFARELSQKGHRVFVIAAENPFDEISPWDKDRVGMNVQYLPAKYPKVLLGRPEGMIEKLSYRANLAGLKLATRGNYYDRASRWKQQLLKKVSELIKTEQIDNLIITGAPFHLLYFGTMIRQRFPHINFIADFRDPWTNNPNFMGFGLLSSKRQSYERNLEKKVVEQADFITVVADDMSDYLKSLGNAPVEKFITLSNGFDPEDFIFEQHSALSDESKTLKFILTGTLYNNTEYIFDSFIDGLKKMQRQQGDIYNAMQFDFYGDAPLEYKKKVKKNGVDIVNFYGKIPLNEVYQKIREAHLGMLFLHEHLNFSFSTKFYEYIALEKKIAVFSRPGKTGEFVESHNIGYQINPDSIIKALVNIYEDFQTGHFKMNTDFDIGSFSLTRLTEKLESLLK